VAPGVEATTKEASGGRGRVGLDAVAATRAGARRLRRASESGPVVLGESAPIMGDPPACSGDAARSALAVVTAERRGLAGLTPRSGVFVEIARAPAGSNDPAGAPSGWGIGNTAASGLVAWDSIEEV